MAAAAASGFPDAGVIVVFHHCVAHSRINHPVQWPTQRSVNREFSGRTWTAASISQQRSPPRREAENSRKDRGNVDGCGENAARKPRKIAKRERKN
jgi:hypothetical protein